MDWISSGFDFDRGRMGGGFIRFLIRPDPDWSLIRTFSDTTGVFGKCEGFSQIHGFCCWNMIDARFKLYSDTAGVRSERIPLWRNMIEVGLANLSNCPATALHKKVYTKSFYFAAGHYESTKLRLLWMCTNLSGNHTPSSDSWCSNLLSMIVYIL